MIAWAHTLSWPVAAVLISANVRRAIGAVALARLHRDEEKEA